MMVNLQHIKMGDIQVFRSFHKNHRSAIPAPVVHMDRCFNIELCLMLSHAKDMIPDICRQYLNNLELHKY